MLTVTLNRKILQKPYYDNLDYEHLVSECNYERLSGWN